MGPVCPLLGGEGCQALQRERERGVVSSPAQSGFDYRLSIGHTLKQCQKVKEAQ